MRFILVIVLCFLSSCATQDQEQSVWNGHGYSELKVANDGFIVAFHANHTTPMMQVMQYAVARAAELTLENGYRYFAILSAMDESKVDTQGSTPGATLLVKCFKEKPQIDNVIDAKQFAKIDE